MTTQNYIKKLRAYRNTHRLELEQLKTIRDLRDIDGNSAEVALLDSMICERMEYLEKIQLDINLAMERGNA